MGRCVMPKKEGNVSTEFWHDRQTTEFPKSQFTKRKFLIALFFPPFKVNLCSVRVCVSPIGSAESETCSSRSYVNIFHYNVYLAKENFLVYQHHHGMPVSMSVYHKRHMTVHIPDSIYIFPLPSSSLIRRHNWTQNHNDCFSNVCLVSSFSSLAVFAINIVVPLTQLQHTTTMSFLLI